MRIVLLPVLIVLFVSLVCVCEAVTMTWYRTGLNACGFVNLDGDPIVATSFFIPADCGKRIRIYNGERESYAFIVDHCSNCADRQLDASPGLFLVFANLESGSAEIEWTYTDHDPTLVPIGSTCGGGVLCTGSTFCSGVCSTLPSSNVPTSNLLPDGSVIAWEQCAGEGYANPAPCLQGFECLSLGTYGRPGYSQCLPSTINVFPRPDYLEVSIPSLSTADDIFTTKTTSLDVRPSVQPSLDFYTKVGTEERVLTTTTTTTITSIHVSPVYVMSSPSKLVLNVVQTPTKLVVQGCKRRIRRV